MERDFRPILGALAGLGATIAMTAAMRRLYPLLEEEYRYPLPPREIIDRTLQARYEGSSRLRTLLAHFGYGALTGAVFGLLPRCRGGGIVYGLGVWALSYLGWIPASGVLSPATRHPFQRNLLMMAAHVVWGVALSWSLKELIAANDEVFSRPAGTSRTVDQQREMEPEEWT